MTGVGTQYNIALQHISQYANKCRPNTLVLRSLWLMSYHFHRIKKKEKKERKTKHRSYSLHSGTVIDVAVRKFNYWAWYYTLPNGEALVLEFCAENNGHNVLIAYTFNFSILFLSLIDARAYLLVHQSPRKKKFIVFYLGSPVIQS